MFSLVADYGTSDEENSSSDQSSTDGSDDETKAADSKQQSENQPSLPSASEMLAGNKKSIPGGVFCNPFKEAEDAKLASLEKHVKMVDPEHETSEQKRKICWSYRKGRCRFGSKCNFAHDSDLILRKELHGSQQEPGGITADSSAAPDGGTSQAADAGQVVRKSSANKKKRPGLSQELVPPKKVLKMYHREKYSGKP